MTRTVALLLLISGGAMVNVAVAWGCAMFLWFPKKAPPAHLVDLTPDEHDVLDWKRAAPPDFPPEPDRKLEAHYAGMNFRNFYSNTSRRLDTPRAAGSPVELEFAVYSASETRAGFPLRSLAGWRFHAGQVTISTETSGFLPYNLKEVGDRSALQVDQADVLPWKASGPRILPYGIIWPGFVINTLIYAAILWLFFLAPFQVRRAVRVRRGRCPKCAYPVGTSAVCTECGCALPASTSP